MIREFGTVSEIHHNATTHAKHRNGIPRRNFATLTPRKPRPDRPAQEGDHPAPARAGAAEAAGGRARATGQAAFAQVRRVGVTRIARRVGEAHSIRRQGPAVAAQPPGTVRERLRKPCRRQRAVDLQLGARAGHAPRRTTGETRGIARDRQARGGAAPQTISGCNQTGKEARAKIALALQFGGAPAAAAGTAAAAADLFPVALRRWRSRARSAGLRIRNGLHGATEFQWSFDMRESFARTTAAGDHD